MRSRLQVRIALVLVAGSTVTGYAVASASTRADVAAAVDANWGAVKTLGVRYRAWRTGPTGESGHIAGTLVVDGNRRFATMWHEGFGSEEADPFAVVQILSDSEWNVYRPYWRYYEVSKAFRGPRFTAKIKGHVFCEANAWWPSEDSERPLKAKGRDSFFLSDVLRDPDYEVAGDAELDGVQCTIVENPGKDRLWVDANRGVLVHRETFEDGSEEPGASYSLSRFREVCPGLWLPFRILRHHRLAKYSVVHEVQSYQVNGDFSELFEFVPPPGSYVHNRDDDTRFQIPGGLDFLDRLIERGRQRIDMQDRVELSAGWLASSCGGVAILAMASVIYVRAYWRQS